MSQWLFCKPASQKATCCVHEAERDRRSRGGGGHPGGQGCKGGTGGCAVNLAVLGWPAVSAAGRVARSASPGFFGELWLESTASVPRRVLANRGEDAEESERTTPAETCKCLGNALVMPRAKNKVGGRSSCKKKYALLGRFQVITGESPVKSCVPTWFPHKTGKCQVTGKTIAQTAEQLGRGRGDPGKSGSNGSESGVTRTDGPRRWLRW